MDKKPKIKRVGNYWVCFIQNHIIGYGKTPIEAYLNWKLQWF